jgi:hypothetical protein
MLVGGTAFARAPANLPVYIEDSHAGSFYWMIRNLPLDRDYQLVLIDAHSDASEILNSDSIRQSIMEAAGASQLDSLIGQWRRLGAIQAFNWIEPLMPHPIAKVWWIPADSLPADGIERRKREVCQEIDAHEAVYARRDGDLSSKYEVSDLSHFQWNGIQEPVVVTIDLDYFAAAQGAEETRRRLGGILDRVLELSNLQAITLSISRPYLASPSQAHLLLYEALRYLVRVVNASIRYEPFADTGEDRSEKAKEFYRQRLQPPRYELEGAPAVLRTLLLQNASRIAVSEPSARWKALLEKWRREPPIPRVCLRVDGRRMPDGTEFTFAAGKRFQLAIEKPGSHPPPRVRWMVLSSAHPMYNLAGEDQGFANGAPRYMVDREEPVDGAGGSAELDGEKLIPFFDKKTGLGTLRVFCEATYGEDVYLSSVIRGGYTGKLTEIFNLPYVYGSALLMSGGRISADARQGADCSHFIIYGRRREGANVPYVNPKDLLPYLELIDEFQGFENGVAVGLHGTIVMTPALLDKGLLLHFGKHVAAVYGNGGKSSLLTGDTLVVHQLEGPPEITTFGAMAAKYAQVRVMTFR